MKTTTRQQIALKRAATPEHFRENSNNEAGPLI